MSVFLSILKIIGIVLAAAAGLVILLVLIALFVPIRYKLKGSKAEDGAEADGYISFLLHIVHLGFYYEDKAIPFVLKIFGISVKKGYFWGEDKDIDINTAADIDTDSDLDTDSAFESGTDSDSDLELNSDTDSDSAFGSGTDSDSDLELNSKSDLESNSNSDLDFDYDSDSDSKRKFSLSEKITAFCHAFVLNVKSIYGRIRQFADNTEESIDKLKREYDFYNRFISDERNKKAVKLAWDELKRILNSIKPRKLSGNINFGFDDPATCGKVLVFLSVLYPYLPRKLNINPDFENEIFEGNVLIKGRVILFVLLVAAWRIYFNKDIKRFVRIYKKHKNKEKE